MASSVFAVKSVLSEYIDDCDSESSPIIMTIILSSAIEQLVGGHSTKTVFVVFF